MHLLQWDPCVELKKISNHLKSYLRANSIPPLDKSRGVDYTGLNAALRRYEQDNIRTGNLEVMQGSKCKQASDISNP